MSLLLEVAHEEALKKPKSALKKENDMLRQCLQDSRKPGAFEAYLAFL